MTRAILETIAIVLLFNTSSCGRTSLDSDLDADWGTAAGGSNSGTVSDGTAGAGNTTNDAQTTNAGGSLPIGGTTSNGTSSSVGGTQATKSTARFVSTGSGHTCAVLSDDSIACWGTNDRGQLGDGTTNHRNTPVKVLGISGATMVATAYDHTCATLSSGELKCWGSNSYGQLGDGTSLDSALPITVPGLTRVSGVDVGGLPGHTCASTLDGTVYCWGNAFNDPNDANNAKLASPMLISDLTPSDVVAVSVGIEHSCALQATGAVQCWGKNNYGQLGDGNTTDNSVPAPIRSSHVAIAIAAGGNTTCALMPATGVQCWGYNSDGQLGNYDLTSRGITVSTTPVRVDGITLAIGIAVGSAHACAIVDDGTVQCWGINQWGQLGDGTQRNRSQPITVTGVRNATGIATGGFHTCAIVAAGSVSCWGHNLIGQLGNGTNIDSLVPVTVTGF